jgi:hypothetical protein
VVPASYHEFFAGCANVAGALVGLLFVAVSISPGNLTGTDATVAFQLRAAAAFSTLVNALVITLFALLPHTNLGIVALVTSLSGLGTTCGLVLIGLRESDLRRVRELVLVIVLFLLYGWQLVNAIRLLHHAGNTDALEDEAILVIVCFLVGIGRAWELVGIRRTGLVHTAVTQKLAARGGAAGAGAGAGAGNGGTASSPTGDPPAGGGAAAG